MLAIAIALTIGLIVADFVALPKGQQQRIRRLG